jgi:hypothetical protein
LAEVFSDMVGSPCLIFYVEMELLQLCGPLHMAIILKVSLCLLELQRLMINVDDCLLPENVMPPLTSGLYNGVYFFIINGLLMNNI